VGEGGEDCDGVLVAVVDARATGKTCQFRESIWRFLLLGRRRWVLLERFFLGFLRVPWWWCFGVGC
jgi:hypothetical protein